MKTAMPQAGISYRCSQNCAKSESNKRTTCSR